MKYYITTAIDYPNAKPHIGHSYEKIAADTIARYHRLRGDDTFFCMGVDENSQHVPRAADANGAGVIEWVDRMATAFQCTWSALDIRPDRFIRTAIDADHARAAQELFRRAQAGGDIYKGTYTGYYCNNCNTFYEPSDLTDGTACPNHPTITPEYLEEENYFFALTRYTDRLMAILDANPTFIMPRVWGAEIRALLQRGLRDFSVSRPVKSARVVDGKPWGIPVPGDPEHVLYVWFDALTNYATAAGLPDDPEGFAHWWPANAHVVGKDITRFHCVYWPAMLMAAGIEVPRQVAVHGFMTLEGQRISKTTGNIIDPIELVEEWGADAVRYYLLRDVAFDRDGDFVRANLAQRYVSDLANDLGNLLNRAISMIARYRGGVVPPIGQTLASSDAALRTATEAAVAGMTDGLDAWDFDGALDAAWLLVRRANQYVDENQPWKLARDQDAAERLSTVLGTVAEALRILSTLLSPVMPTACAKMREQLGLAAAAPGDWLSLSWGGFPTDTRVGAPVPLFPRTDLGANSDAPAR
jgi:methionyl-tRNA synthetase